MLGATHKSCLCRACTGVLVAEVEGDSTSPHLQVRLEVRTRVPAP